MDKLGVFICGMLTGAVALGTAAYFADRYDDSSSDTDSIDGDDEEIRDAELMEEDNESGAVRAELPSAGAA